MLQWKNNNYRLPLILRGARQVGKTTLIDHFSKEFDQYLYFNLEKKVDKDLFTNIRNLDATLQLLFLSKGYANSRKKSSLLFIDEVQELPEVIESLRFFYEDYPHLHVIVTGSLIDFAISKIVRTPVGRVEYAELHPLNFQEYLGGLGNEMAAQLLHEIPLKNEFLPIMYALFHDYAMVGGMPKIVDAYLKEKDLSIISNLYISLITGYKDDVEKYAKNATQKVILRHIMEAAPYLIDNRINMSNFGNSSFKTRDVKEAMMALEKARLLELVYPTTSTAPPVVPNFRKRPRLHFLDIGLVNYQLGIHKELLTISDLHDSSIGKLVQQVVAQEIKSKNYLPEEKQSFWVREERGTTSEVDMIYPYQNMLIPIEIKSGATGRLRSLHEFMDRCNHHYAIRIYGGQLSINQLETRKAKKYYLLNLPYFLSSEMDGYLEWFIFNK